MNIAIITGASSGIGKEFVMQLAKNKDIEEFWLIARRKEKLQEVESMIDQSVTIFPLDLSNEESYTILKNALLEKKPTVKYLVSAAGLGKVDNIQDQDYDTQINMINVNIEASVKVTSLALPYLQKDSHVIEIGSIAGFQPMPHFAIYSATKVFLENYTKTLHYELKKQGIHVTVVCPYWVKDTEFISGAFTEKTKYYGNRFLSTTKAKVVRRSLHASDMNLWVCTPDIVSFLDRIFAKILPHFIHIRIMDGISKL